MLYLVGFVDCHAFFLKLDKDLQTLLQMTQVVSPHLKESFLFISLMTLDVWLTYPALQRRIWSHTHTHTTKFLKNEEKEIGSEGKNFVTSKFKIDCCCLASAAQLIFEKRQKNGGNFYISALEKAN